MEKPRVLHVLYSGLGGHANVVFPLLETPFLQENENYLVFFGVEDVLAEYVEKAESLNIEYFSIIKKPKRYLGAFSKFNEILKSKKPTVIIVHSSELIIPAVRYRKKENGCEVYYFEHENNSSKSFSLNFLSRYALKRANAVVCLNNAYKSQLLKRYSCRVPIEVIPNGINTEKYAPVQKEGGGKIILGMASRMIPGKDHPNLLTAFSNILKTYANAELHIAGNGETEDSVKEIAENLSIQDSVKFRGLLNETEMVEFYSSLTIYVLATHNETLSTSILQAMSCGLPVITSRIENNEALIIDDQTGWFYENNNADDLRDVLNKVMEDPNKANLVGKNARQSILDNYSKEAMNLRYSELIRKK